MKYSMMINTSGMAASSAIELARTWEASEAKPKVHVLSPTITVYNYECDEREFLSLLRFFHLRLQPKLQSGEAVNWWITVLEVSDA
jgi:hypothetical protein